VAAAVVVVGAGCGAPAGVGLRDEPCELGAAVVGGPPEAEASVPVAIPRKRAWEAAHGGEVPARPFVAARVAGWPRPRRQRWRPPASDAAFLHRIARDTWRGLVAFTDTEHALPVDHVRLGPSGGRQDARVGDYTNVTSIGLYLASTVAAHELGLTTRAAAVARVRAVLATLEQLETHDGLFFNYYDTTSLERSSNFLSSVDLGWLTAGLMVVRQGLPELQDAATRWIERGDWRRFYDPVAGRLRHGWWVPQKRPSRFQYGVLYAESRLASLIAIGLGAAPPSHWFGMVRTFPAACGWQRQVPRGRRVGESLGTAVHGGWYEWRGLRYVPSWGGSMFEALMPTLMVDEARWAPVSLGRNDAAHVEVQRRFATETLGLPVWGFSSSATLAPGGYGEHGVPDLGSLGYGPGVVTPYAAALALAVDPAAATENLRALATRYELYGAFGFFDAVDPRTGAVVPVYLTLDQAMLFLAVANRLCEGCVQRHFAADPIAARALPVLALEHFFE
jgi:hypothetical protein